MIDIERKRKFEEVPINSKDYINDLIENKLSLRKQNNNKLIQKKRNYLQFHLERNHNSKISAEQQFQIVKFDKSFNIISNYLNSNNPDLIEYCLMEIDNYFNFYCPDFNEQKKIIETKFLTILLYFGNKYIEEKNKSNLEIILRLLINIQIYEIGNNTYFLDLYSNEFFLFYNNCLLYADKSKNIGFTSHIYQTITTIFNTLALNEKYGNDYFNLFLLRNPAFLKILNHYEEKNIKDQNEISSTIELIIYVVDLSDEENANLTNEDIKIFDKCLNILIYELYSKSNEELLAKILYGIRLISNLNDDYKFNKKIINEGVTLKLLKMKFNNKNPSKNYIKVIQNAMGILANNLVLSDNTCQIIYDQNIIDYYNNILEKFDDDKKIVRFILTGLTNISIGSNRDIIKDSVIWQEKRIIKYLSLGDELTFYIIKIVKYFLYKEDFEYIQFIFKTNIMKYFLDLFVAGNIGKIICFKILKIVDQYLSYFKLNLKETNEYLFVYNRFKDVFANCEKIILLREENNIIPVIEKKIEKNYE